MNFYRTLPLLSLGFAPVIAHADIVDDSKATLTLRNFYYNHDLRDVKAPAQSKIEEWAQGFIFKAQSGYTDTPIGVGVDVYAGLGLKLDSSPGRSGSELLPGFTKRLGSGRDSDPSSVDQYSEGTAALKFKYSKTELKVGGLFPKIPLVFAGDSRLLPQFFEGAMLDSQEIDHFTFSLGQMRQTNYRGFSHSGDMQTGNYLSVSSDRFNYLGTTWNPVQSFTLGVWAGELEDVYRQKLITATQFVDVGAWRLSGTLNYTDTGEQGSALAGPLDSRLTSVLTSAAYGMHKVTLGYQYNAGNNALPFLQETDLPGVANAIQVMRFDRAQERSWQGRYDINFAGWGVPGLTAFARYVHGDNFEINGQPGKEWERNIDLSYVIQSGTFKDVALRWRNVEIQGDATGRRDENRVILSYTIALK
ncbi:OprD family porin [Pseudomonas poae]|uniref:Outer membrane porin, OprD family n=1 Tax=Pseudomonas poae TaxID=200451 RepID=A0A2S9EJ84_9PSED|nr:OprD family porin [Pseudomonas poae]PRA26199.1 outer membrane porin, OprD family [Pseudomonas poae]PRC15364.1 outer membrane porin, OprD family [Pseudomonas poae]